MKKTKLLITLLLLLNLSILTAQDGSLDTNFDTDGLVNTDINSDNDSGKDVAVQSDGKIIVVGYSYDGSNNSFSIVRYNTDGTLDTSFDGDGKANLLIGASCEAYSVEIQANGTILVGGVAWTGSSNDFAVARFNSDGTIDNTFGTGGSVTTGFGGDDHHGRSLAVQSNGKILLGGFLDGGSFPGGGDFGIVRYNSDGTLDTSFDTDGKTTIDFGGGYDSGKDIAVDSNGKIIIVGGSDGSTGKFAVARLNTDGSLDTSFDTDGKVTTTFGSNFDYGYCVAIQNDNKIVVGGQTFDGSYDNFAVVRYNTDGTLDNTFSGDGKVSTTFGNSYDYSYDAVIQSDGKILIAGNSYNTTTGKDLMVVSRYNIDGTLDTSFDTDGKVSVDFNLSSSGTECSGIAIQSDNKILLAGSVVSGTFDFAIARLNNFNSSSTISVSITALLEGAYSGTNMTAALTVPTTSPYTEDLETISSIPIIPSNEVVDWVLVQLRDKTDESIILESQSAFILQDGSIVDLDGSSPVHFTLTADDYFISVKHRNHLKVMSKEPVTSN